MIHDGRELPIRDELKEQVDEYRAKMIELAVEQDDDAMMAYLEGEEPDEATLKALIRKGTLSGAFVPMVCGSAFKNKGVQPLLDAICDYLPAPTDLPDMKVRRELSGDMQGGCCAGESNAHRLVQSSTSNRTTRAPEVKGRVREGAGSLPTLPTHSHSQETHCGTEAAGRAG